MRKLVIGCGYLGKRVAQQWLSHGHEVWTLTRSSNHAVRFAESGFKTITGDVLEPDTLKQLPTSETVLYAVGFDRTSSASKREVYVDGLRNVLQEIQKRCRRFVYISSTSVYGQNCGELVDESSPVTPSEESGCISHEAETVVQEYCRWMSKGSVAAASEAIILRLAGIYGPGRLLARVEQLQSGDRFCGNPEAWLNLIQVEDAVKAVLAAESRGQPSESYVVCDDRPLRRREYYTALSERLGVPLPLFQELSEDSPERRRLNKRCVNRRMREELKVELAYPTFIEGLRSLPEVRQSSVPH